MLKQPNWFVSDIARSPRAPVERRRGILCLLLLLGLTASSSQLMARNRKATTPNTPTTKNTADFTEFNFPATPEELVGIDTNTNRKLDIIPVALQNQPATNPAHPAGTAHPEQTIGATQAPATPSTNSASSVKTESPEQAPPAANLTELDLDQALDQDSDTPFTADISLNFENASLLNFLKKVEAIFKISFVFDEDLNPAKDNKTKENKEPDSASNNSNTGTKEPGTNSSKSGLENSKISFATNQPLTKRELWHLTDQFLKVAGYARVRVTGVREPIYRITAMGNALQEVVPVFINVDVAQIRTSGVIRYIYFLKNSAPAQMLEVLDKLKSKYAKISSFANLRALIFTDTAYNIKSLMEIVQALDQAHTPEMLSIIKLKKADATEIADLIRKLAGNKDQGSADKYGYQSPFLKSNKLSSSLKEARVIVESRSNTLLVLGTRAAIATVEQIVQEFDTDLQRRRTNFWVVPLNHTPAKQMADLLNKVTQFGDNNAPAAGSNLGTGQARLHGKDRLFGELHFEPEGQGNNLIIRGEPEDYKLVLEVIKELDKKQPQVAIEAIVVNVSMDDTQGLYSQINSAQDRNVNAATSGWATSPTAGVVTNSVTDSLIGNLLNLVTNPATTAGTTLISLGKQSAWALLGIFSRYTRTNVLASPFIITTNKYPGKIIVGQTRRVQSGTVVATGASRPEDQSLSANLELNIVPQINPNGMISLQINVNLATFTNAYNQNDLNSGNTTSKSIQTCANIANGEVLALGGLTRRFTTATETNVPILSKIPLLGNLFRNRKMEVIKETLLIFITPRIITNDQGETCSYTLNKSEELQQALGEIDQVGQSRDPIVKWFFKTYQHEDIDAVQKFVDRRQGAPGAVCLAPTGAPTAQLADAATTVPPRRKSALLASVPDHQSTGENAP